MFFIIAVIIAALSGMGVGGGGLFSLYLGAVSNYSQIEIQGLNLLFFLFAAGSSVLIHLLRRRIFVLPLGLMLAAGIPGSLLGSRLALLADGALLRDLLGIMMISAGIFKLKKSL